MLLVLVVAGVAALVRARSRLAAVVLLGGIGIVVTVQLFALGAPDVGLTQLLVEVLTVIVLMLVMRKLPVDFGRPRRSYAGRSAAVAIAVGAATALVAWTLTNRRPRSELAEYYLVDGPKVSGATNIVNVILVEFRALDTLGELTVLGMTGVAIVAIVRTISARHLDPPPHVVAATPSAVGDRPEVPDLAAEGKRARVALEDPLSNTEPLRLLQRVLIPILAAISIILFLRGHNAPGGGFIAALVGCCAVSYAYLAAATDRPVSRSRLPVWLIAGGVLVAVITGLWGYLGGSFLEPLHAEIGPVHVTTSMLFDVGVYAAVVGLVLVAFNVLGVGADRSVGGDSPNAPAPSARPETERAEASS